MSAAKPKPTPPTLAAFKAEQAAKEEAYLRRLLEAANWSLYRAAEIADCRLATDPRKFARSTIQKMVMRYPKLEAERVRQIEGRPPGKLREE